MKEIRENLPGFSSNIEGRVLKPVSSDLIKIQEKLPGNDLYSKEIMANTKLFTKSMGT